MAPVVDLRRPVAYGENGRRRPSTGRRPEAPDLSRLVRPIFETHPRGGVDVPESAINGKMGDNTLHSLTRTSWNQEGTQNSTEKSQSRTEGK